MNDHIISRDKLQRYLSGETDLEDLASIRAWVSSDEKNLETFLNERRLFDIVNLHIEKTSGQEYRFQKHIREFCLALAGVAAVILTVIVICYDNIPFFNNKSEEYQTISTLGGQSTVITLPDSSIVILNSLSSVTYSQNYGRKLREVRLSGEAYFDVQKDKSSPFIVRTKCGDVKVTGTKLNVEAYDESGEFVTSLFNGSVQIIRNEDIVSLEPGEMAFLEDGSIVTASIVDYSHYRWKDGYICFMDENLTEILISLEKNFGYKFDVDPGRVFKKRFSGKFRKNDDVDNILDVLQSAIQFSYDVDDQNRIITIK